MKFLMLTVRLADMVASHAQQVAVAILPEKIISEVVLVYLLLTHVVYLLLTRVVYLLLTRVVFCLQHVPPEIWWYYIVELGFYCSLMLSLFMDGKRKVRAFNYCFRCVTRRTRINA